MRLLVMSDSHGDAEGLERVFELHRDDCDAFIHLGDGLEEASRLAARYPDKRFVTLRGNCDYRASGDTEALLELGGAKLFCTHGHKYGVKYDYGTLCAEARRLGASAALFGHTHQPFCERRGGLWLMNPGSLSLWNRGALCFGLVEISEKGELYCVVTSVPRASEYRPMWY